MPTCEESSDVGSILKAHRVVLFINGTPATPRSSFCVRAVRVLNSMCVPYLAVDVSTDPALRDALRLFSGTSTVPQLFLNREPIGGSDVILEMYRTGELHRAIQLPRDASSNAQMETDPAPTGTVSLLSNRIRLTGSHDRGVTGLALLNGGSHLLSSSWDGTVKIRSTGHDGSPDLTLHSSSAVTCINNHSAERIFWGDAEGGITEYSATTNRLASHGQICTSPISSLLFVESHEVLLCVLLDGAVVAYSITHRTVKLVFGPSRGAMCIAHANWKDHAIIGCADGQIRVLNIESAEVLRAIEAHRGPVSSLCSLSNGRLVSGGWDHTIRIWHEDSFGCVRVLRGHSGWITSIVNWKGSVASSSTDRTVRLWDVETGECNRISAGMDASVDCLAPPAETLGGYLYSGTSSGSIVVHLVEPHSATDGVREHKGHRDSVWTVTLQEGSRTIVSGGADGQICLWDAERLDRIVAIPAHRSWVTSVASVDGLLYSGSADGSVCVWKLPSLCLMKRFVDHGSWINCIAAKGSALITGLSDGSVIFRDLRFSEGGVHRNIKAHEASVWTVGLCADAALAASGSADRTIRLLDLKSGVEIGVLRGHSCGVTSVALSSDGHLAVSASLDHTLRVWDVESRTTLRTLVGHAQRVWMVALKPDGSTAVSASADGTLRVWDLRTGRCDILLHGSSPFTSCAISSDGQMVVAGDRIGGVHSVKL